MKYTKLLLALFASTLLFSCKKADSTDNNKPADNLNSLEKKLVGRWQFIKSVDSTTNADGTTKSVVETTEDCERDDIYTFRSDKKYTIDFGNKSCSPYEEVFETVWSIRTDSNFNFDRISIVGSSNPVVVNLDDAYFVIRIGTNPAPYSGRLYKINTYKKK